MAKKRKKKAPEKRDVETREVAQVASGHEIGVDPERLWAAADKLRGERLWRTGDAAEYKYVVLGLIFLKYISDAFEGRRAALREELAADGIEGERAESLLESRDEYTAENVFWVPPEARWGNLQNQAKRAEIAKLIDDAMYAIERDNSVFGQESNPTTWRMAHMNLAIRGIEANLGEQPSDSFVRDLHPDLKAENLRQFYLGFPDGGKTLRTA